MNRALPVACMVVMASCAARPRAVGTAEPATPSPTAPSEPPPAPVRLTTADGLVIEDQRVGTGPPCPSGAVAVVEFTAHYADGTFFDSSDRRARPTTLDLSSPSVIRGLREGVPGMRVGGTRRLVIPWRLAYGEQGREPIPPRTDLVFDLELISFR